MDNNKIKVVREKHSFGIIEYHYRYGKLFEKIDYSTSKPWLWRYDSKGNLLNIKVLESKSHKKLWLGVIGSLLVLAYLYNKCNSTKHIPEQQPIRSSQYQR